MPDAAGKGCFGLVGPPADMEHLYQFLDWYRRREKRFSSDRTLLKLLEWLPPFKAATLSSLVSAAGVEVEGHQVMCPILPEMAETVGDDQGFKQHVVRRVFESCKVAADNGAQIAALGGYSSIVVVGLEDQVSKVAGIPVTSGNTFTAWLALQGIYKAVEWLGVDIGEAEVAVIGASGDIGRGVCQALAKKVRKMTLTARNLPRLEEFAHWLQQGSCAEVVATADNRAAASDSDIIVSTAISAKPLIGSEDVKIGAIVCDVGYPKNIAAGLEDREDVFVFGGGLSKPPFIVDFGYDIRLPSCDTLYGCFSEAILLTLEGRIESYSVGRGGISVEKMEEMGEAAARHGFTVSDFYSGKRKLTLDDADRIRRLCNRPGIDRETLRLAESDRIRTNPGGRKGDSGIQGGIE